MDQPAEQTLICRFSQGLNSKVSLKGGGKARRGRVVTQQRRYPAPSSSQWKLHWTNGLIIHLSKTTNVPTCFLSQTYLKQKYPSGCSLYDQKSAGGLHFKWQWMIHKIWDVVWSGFTEGKPILPLCPVQYETRQVIRYISTTRLLCYGHLFYIISTSE